MNEWMKSFYARLFYTAAEWEFLKSSMVLLSENQLLSGKLMVVSELIIKPPAHNLPPPPGG